MHVENRVTPEQISSKYFVRWWVFRTLLGIVLGVIAGIMTFVVMFAVGNAFEANYKGLATILLLVTAFSIFGLILGNAQWPDPLLAILPRRKWMIANAVGSITGLLGAHLIVTYAPPLFSKFVSDDSSDFRYAGYSVLSNQWFLTILIWSVALGLGLGIAEWVVLRNRTDRAYWIIFANIGSILAAFLLALLISSTIDYSYIFVYGWCSLPIMVGIGGGVAVKHIVFHKQKP